MAGLFSGGTLALLIVLGILFHQLLPNYRPVSERKQQPATLASSDVYFESVFPVFRYTNHGSSIFLESTQKVREQDRCKASVEANMPCLAYGSVDLRGFQLQGDSST